jgi:uncharacterized protein (TIGR03083 family)
VRALLEEQFDALADWLDAVPVSDHLVVPVGLGDWTVRELVAHLAMGIGLSRHVTTAPPGTTPLTLGSYVQAYPPAAGEIDRATHQLATAFGDDLVGGFRRSAAEAFAALDATPGDVLLARRGPIARDDYLATRLLELVVHGDDLHRALVDADAEVLPAPLLAAAVDTVAGALAAAYVERSGTAPADAAGLPWLRRATGRVPAADPQLPLL